MAGDDDEALERLARLIAASPHNLVSSRERDVLRLREAHFREAVALGHALPLGEGQEWVDIGTGGGIPGLVLALEYPTVTWVLMDSVEKKVRAVREFAAALGLENVSVVAGRAESLAHDREFRARFDGVVARAVAPLVVLVELARGFVRPGGMLAAVKGPAWEAEVEEARWAIRTLGWREPHSELLGPTVRPAWLVSMRAAGPARRDVPRRAGIPQRRPLVRRAVEG